MWSIVRNVTGGLVVAAVVAIFSLVGDMRSDHRKLADLVSEIVFRLKEAEKDINNLNDFMFKGERFTKEMGSVFQSELEDINERDDELEDDIELVQRDINAINLKIEGLPNVLRYPFDKSWQDRITANERASVQCEQAMRDIRLHMGWPTGASVKK